MKFGITKFEKLALTAHLVAQPSPGPEHGRKRLKTWDELVVVDLAEQLAATAAGFSGDVKASDWADRKTYIAVDINADVLDFIINGTGGQIEGRWADVISRLRERFEQLKAGKYEPPEGLA